MHVFLIAAITADGFIGCDDAHLSTTWTSKEDKKWFNERTKQAGVMVMGSKTYATINRALPGRLTLVYSSKPGPADLPEDVRFVQIPPADLIKYAEKEGYQEVAICGGSNVYTQFMKAGVVDTLYLTIEPVVFGNGVKLFSDEINKKLTLKNCTRLGAETLLLEYQVLKGES